MPHTPGPWYEAKTGNHQGLVISEATGANVAVAYDKQDASLVAAAPCLLAAADETWKGIDKLVEHWDEHSPEHIRSQLRDFVTEVLCPAIMKAKSP